MAALPKNAHISSHPCVAAKLSQLRSHTTNAREVKALIHEIALIVGVEALAHGLTVVQTGTVCISLFLRASLNETNFLLMQDKSPLNYTYPFYSTSPTSISLIPILRSGLSMIDALSSLLPQPVPIHHLGLYREKSTLQPVEYYNNLPYVKNSSSGRGGAAGEASSGPAELAIVVDPVIATGATAEAAVETLRDWGVKRVIVIAVIGSTDGVRRVAESWIEDGVSKVELFVGGCDDETDAKGMIKPGLGDVGDRLFLTVGKG